MGRFIVLENEEEAGENVTPGRTMKCDQRARQGRLAKAVQFYEAAELIETLAESETHRIDAYITNCVLAGIAAADVICCARLGVHAQDDDHREAVALLEQVDKSMAGHLNTLLNQKTRSGYSALISSLAAKRQAGRAAKALVEFAKTA